MPSISSPNNIAGERARYAKIINARYLSVESIEEANRLALDRFQSYLSL